MQKNFGLQLTCKTARSGAAGRGCPDKNYGSVCKTGAVKAVAGMKGERISNKNDITLFVKCSELVIEAMRPGSFP